MRRQVIGRCRNDAAEQLRESISLRKMRLTFIEVERRIAVLNVTDPPSPSHYNSPSATEGINRASEQDADASVAPRARASENDSLDGD
jgi:hypothetical protein